MRSTDVQKLTHITGSKPNVQYSLVVLNKKKSLFPFYIKRVWFQCPERFVLPRATSPNA